MFYRLNKRIKLNKNFIILTLTLLVIGSFFIADTSHHPPSGLRSLKNWWEALNSKVRNFSIIERAHAAINQQINYQGKLTDSGNVTVANGTYTMVFKLYTAPSGGSPIWTETRNGGNKVQVTSGLFSVMLGSVTSLAGIDFNQTLYLGVTIESDSEMTPRKILGTVPAAFEALNLGGASSTQYVRSDQAGTISASSTQNALAIIQTGSGNALGVTGNGTFTGTLSASNLSGTNTGDQTITLTGDVTGSGTGSFAATLATVNGNVGSFGSSTAIPSFTVNAKGLITAASTNAVIAPAGTLTGTTLAANVVTSSLTSVGTIGTGVWQGTAMSSTFGGTGQTTYATGDMLYASGTNTLAKRTIGATGDVLWVSGGVPTWTATSSLGFLSSSITSSLTNGFMPRWNGSALINSIVRENGTVAGINATSSSYTFNLQGSSGINPFNVASSTGISLFTILNNGNVGVGTTTPGSALTVAGNGLFTGTLAASNLSGTNTGNVTLAGENYLSLVGQVITANPVDLSTGNVANVLAIGNGGTGSGDGSITGSGNLVFADNNSNSITMDGNGVNINSSRDIALFGAYGRSLYIQPNSSSGGGIYDTYFNDSDGNHKITFNGVGDGTFVGNLSAANLSGTNTGDQTITLTGDITGSGTGSFATVYNGTVPVSKGGTGQTTYTNGQLLIGNTTGNTLTKAALTGTANQVIVTNGAGSITLSTPQDIGTLSQPQFQRVALSNNSSFGGYVGNLGLGSDWIGITADGAAGVGTYGLATSPGSGTIINAAAGIIDLRFVNGAHDPIFRMYDSGGLYYGSVAGAANPGAGNLGIFSGKLGIGTTTLTELLHVTSSSGAARIVIDSGAGTNEEIKFLRLGVVQNVIGTDYTSGNFVIGTSNLGAGAKVSIDINGKVGIGSTAPQGLLSVASSNIGGHTAGISTWSNKFSIFGPNVGSATGAALGFGYDTTDDASAIISLAPNVAWKPLYFNAASYNYYLSGASSASLTLNSSGNVGIGTSTPANKLGVLGSASIGSTYAGTAAPTSGLIVEGNVGVGTTAPTEKMTVVDGGNVNILSGTFGVYANNGTQGIGFGYQGISKVGSNANSDLFIDAKGTGNIFLQTNASGKVGIGTNSPSSKLHVLSTTEQLRVGYDASNYYKTTVGSSGGVTFDAVGSGAGFTFADNVTLQGSANALGYINSGTWGANIVDVAYGGTGASGFNTGYLPYYNGGALADSTLFTDATFFGLGTPTPQGMLHILPAHRTYIPLIVQASASQSTNLTEWWDENSSLLSYVDVAGTFSNSSNRNLKENFRDLDKNQILDKINALNVQSWNYKSQGSSTSHIGPVAQDFYQLFHLGDSDKTISTIDPAGVALVGIQALSSKLESTNASTTSALSSLELRVGSIESLTANVGGSLNVGIFGDLLSTLQSFGTEIVDGISYMKDFFVQHFTAQNLTIKGKDVTKTGFTIYDRATGDPICVYFENGDMKSEEGECPDSTEEDSSDVSDNEHNESGDSAGSDSSNPPAEETASSTESTADSSGDSDNSNPPASEESLNPPTVEEEPPAQETSPTPQEETSNESNEPSDSSTDSSGESSSDNSSSSDSSSSDSGGSSDSGV